MIPYKVFEAFVLEKSYQKEFICPHRKPLSRRDSLRRQALALERPEHRSEILQELHEFVTRYKEYQNPEATKAVVFPREFVRRELYLKCRTWGWRGKEKNANLTQMSIFLRSRGASEVPPMRTKHKHSSIISYITNQYRTLYLRHFQPANFDMFRTECPYDLDELDKTTLKDVFHEFVGHGRTRRYNVQYIRKSAALSSSGISFVPVSQLPEDFEEWPRSYQ